MVRAVLPAQRASMGPKRIGILQLLDLRERSAAKQLQVVY
jgi:hypothetical protein